MNNILVCDDDRDIVKAVAVYLKAEGYQVIEAYDGVQAMKAAQEHEIHCAVLDIMMPGMDGLSVTLKMRERYNFPIILLSAKSEDTDKIAGLGFGADDYVTKPYNPLELMARIKSQLRRYMSLGSLPKNENLLQTGGLSLDRGKKIVLLDGEEIRLTAHEFGILEYLMLNMGNVLSTAQIYENVWNEPSFTSEKTVTVHIRRIREKIEINPKDPKYLKVVWGIGYKVEKLSV